MGEVISPYGVRAQYIEVMGSDLGRPFYTLVHDVVWLHGKWDQFRRLYAKSPERVQLLNQTAGFFFHMLQVLLWEDVLLHIARLVDRKATGHQRNLSLEQLEEYLQDPVVRSQYAELVRASREKAEFARAWRNKRLAHRDLNYALDKAAHSLPDANVKLVTEALAAIGAALNWVQDHHGMERTKYDKVIEPLNDVTALVDYLRAGLEAEEQRFQRIASGNPLPSDLRPPQV